MMNLWRQTGRTLAMALVAVGAVVPTTAAETVSPTSSFGATSCAADVRTRTTWQPQRQPLAVKAASQASVRRAAQVTRNDKADVTFEVRPSADGGIEVSGRRGSLLVRKTVQSTGDFTLDLATDRDKVTIAVTAQGWTVTRGRSRVEQRRAGAATDVGNQARRLLADSDSVLRFRAVSAALIDADDRSPGAVAFMIADAVVGMLTGDVGAPRRAARFLAQPGLSKRRPVSMALDCFALMEDRMVSAWVDYSSCWVSVYPNDFFQEVCAVRWYIQVESYWFGFLSCSGFNW